MRRSLLFLTCRATMTCHVTVQCRHDLGLHFHWLGCHLSPSACSPSSDGVRKAEVKIHLVHTWKSGQVSLETVVLTNMRRLGMLSDCTRGFLYSQISSGWMTLWKGSKNSVKLKQNKERRVRAEHAAAAPAAREDGSCAPSGGGPGLWERGGDHRLPQLVVLGHVRPSKDGKNE